jgi:hypothetical protein
MTGHTLSFSKEKKNNLNLTGFCSLDYHETSKFECEPDNFGNYLFHLARARGLYVCSMARNPSYSENCIFTRREQWEYLLL